MDFILNTKLEIIYSTIVLVSIYIKIIIFISLITIIFKRYLRTKNKLFVNYPKSSNYVLSLLLFYIIIDNMETYYTYKFNTNILKQYNQVHVDMYHEYNTKLGVLELELKNNIAKIYDDYKFEPKPIDTLKINNINNENIRKSK
jgi:hypothetical protein